MLLLFVLLLWDVVIVVENVIVVVLVAVAIVSYLRFFVFSSFRSFFPFCASKMGMTTTVTSFACLHVDITCHEGSGIKEVSNSYRIPPIYCSGCLPRKFFVFLMVVAIIQIHLPRLVDHS